jgi:hypothetical protein
LAVIADHLRFDFECSFNSSTILKLTEWQQRHPAFPTDEAIGSDKRHQQRKKLVVRTSELRFAIGFNGGMTICRINARGFAAHDFNTQMRRVCEEILHA